MTKTEPARVIATWFGCGNSPWAPGTAGSIGALVPVILLDRAIPLSGWAIAALGVAMFVPAVWAADMTATELGAKDPGSIVVDEVVGQWITMAGAVRLNWKSWAAAFVLFRLFDILKPFPIRRLEKLPGGLGIVSDDGLAGIYAALVLFLMGWFNLY